MSLIFPASWNRLSPILAHDWLTGMRGGERVLELLCEGFPEAPVYTLLHRRGSVSERIESHPIHTSFLQRAPRIHAWYRNFLPLFPSAVAGLQAGGGDLLISTSHCAIKGMRPPGRARHLCYCFTPMRYAWTFYEEYFGRNPLKKAVLRPMLASLRRWDRETADRVDLFVAISRHVQQRIRDCYGRESDVVYPPVDTERCTPGNEPSADFDLIVSALVPYKRIDLAVRAYNRLGFPLKIVGVGTEYRRLRAAAKANIDFLGWRSDDEVLDLYRNCRCLVFPGEEDFGIVPLEAQACGRPVVAYGRGGVLETVANGQTGVFFDRQTDTALLEAVETCASSSWDPRAARANAERFDTQTFIDALDRSIAKVAG